MKGQRAILAAQKSGKLSKTARTILEASAKASTSASLREGIQHAGAQLALAEHLGKRELTSYWRAVVGLLQVERDSRATSDG